MSGTNLYLYSMKEKHGEMYAAVVMTAKTADGVFQADLRLLIEDTLTALTTQNVLSFHTYFTRPPRSIPPEVIHHREPHKRIMQLGNIVVEEGIVYHNRDLTLEEKKEAADAIETFYARRKNTDLFVTGNR